MKIYRIIFPAMFTLYIVGCTTTPQKKVVADAGNLANIDICNNYVEDYDLVKNYELLEDGTEKIYVRRLNDEVLRRKLDLQACNKLVSERNGKVAAVAVAAALIGAVAYGMYKSRKNCEEKAKRNNQIPNCRGGYSGLSSSKRVSSTKQNVAQKTQKVGWDWDQFYDSYGNLLSRCRDVASGQFIDSEYCNGLPKDDDRWPEKVAP